MVGLVCRIATRITKPDFKIKQWKKYPNPEEPYKTNFSSNSCLFLKLWDRQQNTRIAKPASSNFIPHLHYPFLWKRDASVQCFPSPPLCPTSLTAFLPALFNSLSRAALVPAATPLADYPLLQIFWLFPVPPIQLILYLLPAQVWHLPIPQLTSLHHKHLFWLHPFIHLSWCSMNFAVFPSVLS